VEFAELQGSQKQARGPKSIGYPGKQTGMTSPVGLAPVEWAKVGKGGKSGYASSFSVPAECCELLGKEREVATEVATAQAKSPWLVSGATVILNFC
jgi:hypothetical protein